MQNNYNLSSQSLEIVLQMDDELIVNQFRNWISNGYFFSLAQLLGSERWLYPESTRVYSDYKLMTRSMIYDDELLAPFSLCLHIAYAHCAYHAIDNPSYLIDIALLMVKAEHTFDVTISSSLSKNHPYYFFASHLNQKSKLDQNCFNLLKLGFDSQININEVKSAILKIEAKKLIGNRSNQFSDKCIEELSQRVGL